MRRCALLTLSLSLSALACRSTARHGNAGGDAGQQLFATVSGLEGRWEGSQEVDGMQLVHEFHTISAGSVVRETMFPGAPHEMENMYVLDGDALAMTHYCAMGNQPRMCAQELENGRLVFHFDRVDGLATKQGAYMGEMTLVLVDEGHIEEHWRAFKDGKLDHEAVFQLQRVR